MRWEVRNCPRKVLPRDFRGLVLRVLWPRPGAKIIHGIFLQDWPQGICATRPDVGDLQRTIPAMRDTSASAFGVTSQRSAAGSGAGGFGEKYSTKASIDIGSHDAAKIRLATNPAIQFLFRTEAKPRMPQVSSVTVTSNIQNIHKNSRRNAIHMIKATMSRIDAPNITNGHQKKGPPLGVNTSCSVR